MKFSIASDELISLLARSSLLATGDRTHPAFGVMHLQCTAKGRLKAHVINAVAGALNSAQTSSAGSSVPGSVCITHQSVKKLQALLPTKSEVSVMLPAGETSMRVRSDDLAVRIDVLPSEDAMEFPAAPSAESGVAWNDVSAEDVGAICTLVAPFVAPEKDGRMNLQSVHMTPQFSEASDGRRCVRLPKTFISAGTKDICIPHAMFSVLADYVGSKTPVRIAVTDTQLWVVSKSWAVFCRLVDIPFPNVDALYYQPNKDGEVADYTGKKYRLYAMSVDRKAMAKAGQRISAIYEKTDQNQNKLDAVPIAKFTMKDDTLMAVVSKASGGGIDFAQKIPWTADEKFVVDEAGAKEISDLRVNARFMSSIFMAMTDDNVRVTWTHSRDRMQIEQVDGMKALLMPRTDQ